MINKNTPESLLTLLKREKVSVEKQNKEVSFNKIIKVSALSWNILIVLAISFLIGSFIGQIMWAMLCGLILGFISVFIVIKRETKGGN
jgi:F0F1-type ATP synthase assembly protein I